LRRLGRRRLLILDFLGGEFPRCDGEPTPGGDSFLDGKPHERPVAGRTAMAKSRAGSEARRIEERGRYPGFWLRIGIEVLRA
jgi:hypothetical protein